MGATPLTSSGRAHQDEPELLSGRQPHSLLDIPEHCPELLLPLVGRLTSLLFELRDLLRKSVHEVLELRELVRRLAVLFDFGTLSMFAVPSEQTGQIPNLALITADNSRVGSRWRFLASEKQPSEQESDGYISSGLALVVDVAMAAGCKSEQGLNEILGDLNFGRGRPD
jgi:hypothetical protein